MSFTFTTSLTVSPLLFIQLRWQLWGSWWRTSALRCREATLAAWPWRWLSDGRGAVASRSRPASAPQVQFNPRPPSPLYKANWYQHTELKGNAAALEEKGQGGWGGDGISGTPFWGSWSWSAPHVMDSWRRQSNSMSVWRRSCGGRTRRCTSSRGWSLHWGRRMATSGWRFFCFVLFFCKLYDVWMKGRIEIRRAVWWSRLIYIRRRAEEAREALRLGLERVRLIQEQAQSVPQLQSRIAQLETELHQYRYKQCVMSEWRKGHRHVCASIYTSFASVLWWFEIQYTKENSLSYAQSVFECSVEAFNKHQRINA